MPPRCTEHDGPHGNPHAGEHRATFTIQGVGKALFKWKVRMVRPFSAPVPLKGRRKSDLV